MMKYVVRDECLVRQGSGHGVNAMEVVTAIAAGASKSQRSESKGGADAPQMGVFSHAETIQQVMSLNINTTGVKENRRGGRRKEHERACRIDQKK